MSEAELRAALQRPGDRGLRIEPEADSQHAVAEAALTGRESAHVPASESRL